MHTAMAQRLGLGDTDLAAMDHLVNSEAPLGTVDLGNRLGIRSASATVLVDRLVAAGHLDRTAHPTDRRRVQLHITESARAEVLQTLLPLRDAVATITGRLSAEEAAAILTFLNDALAAVRDFVDEPQPTASQPDRRH